MCFLIPKSHIYTNVLQLDIKIGLRYNAVIYTHKYLAWEWALKTKIAFLFQNRNFNVKIWWI